MPKSGRNVLVNYFIGDNILLKTNSVQVKYSWCPFIMNDLNIAPIANTC